MNSIRSFIAVDLSAEITGRANDLIRRLRTSGAKVKWVEGDQMHVTLKFLGDVPNTEIPAICQALTDVAAQHAPFQLVSRGAGAYPDLRRPRTLWLGFEPCEAIERLQRSIDDAMRRLGFPSEHRRFRPHLTIGRVRQGGPSQDELARLLQHHAQFDGGCCEVDEVIVYASFLDRQGPTYDVMGRAPLLEPVDD
jgi:2'-5' RNA ligase